MYKPSKQEIKEIEAELQAEKGREVEWDSWNEIECQREEDRYDANLHENIIRQAD